MKKKKEESKMKRKLALLLTVTMLATSVYTPWLANAAEFTSGEENSLYTEEKPETEEIEAVSYTHLTLPTNREV